MQEILEHWRWRFWGEGSVEGECGVNGVKMYVKFKNVECLGGGWGCDGKYSGLDSGYV